MRALCLILSAFVLCAFSGPERVLTAPKQEARALALFKELRCPTCIAQSIHDSDAAIAVDLRAIVREQIQQGRSNAQIKDYLIARYGEVILLRPPLKTNTLPLWLGPWLMFLFGGVVVFFVVRRHGVKLR